MPRCIGVTTHGVQCGRNALVGERCVTHERIHQQQLEEAGPEIPHLCNKFMKRAGNNRWSRCQRVMGEGGNACWMHENGERRMQIRNAERGLRNAQVIMLAAQDAQTRWELLEPTVDAVGINDTMATLAIMEINGELGMAVRIALMTRLADHFGLHNETVTEMYRAIFVILLGRLNDRPVEAIAAAPRPQGLAALAEDRQNVHTAPVTHQTNRGVDILLNQTPIPSGQFTMREILVEWLTTRKDVNYDDILKTERDMWHWYNTKSCRVVNDKLYQKLLQRLWSIIKEHSCKPEMSKRLFEECHESVGLCCDGHINRLVNVMVGFDDRFAPEISVKEQLQNRMAALSGQEIPDEEKRTQAKSILLELQIPEIEHHIWLSAF